MLFLTKLHLENFCGYTHHTFDFTKPDGSPYQFICFFGPNGDGKTNLLGAINLLTANQTGRSSDNVRHSLLKLVKNKNYTPSYERISGHKYKDDFAVEDKNNLPHMVIEGTYKSNGDAYVVRISQDGFERNDFVSSNGKSSPWGDDSLRYRQRIAHSVTSDSDLSMSKFQLHKELAPIFEEIASKIMRFPTQCVPPSGIVPMDFDYCTDFTVLKRGDLIHYKSMSAGEQKIAKSFSQLLNLVYDLEHPEPGDPLLEGWPRLLLIDNIEMHVYYDRHIAMVECMKKCFSQHQIFATTHSGVLIPRYLEGKNDGKNELYFNLEEIHIETEIRRQ